MHITLAAIGKLASQSSEQQLISQYIKRLPWRVSIHEMQVKKTVPTPQLKAMETDLLLGCVPEGAKIVALDERGKTLSSPVFAKTLQDWQDGGSQRVAFLIGGAAGHDAKIYDKTHLTLSFGAMTWPHMLVRSMLCEQLYRAYTINTGHPYHKE